MPKAEKVTPPMDMDEHNAQLRDDSRSTAEVESDAEFDASSVAVLTTAEVAEKLETTPRTLRKFLRSKGSGIEPVGQGKRYALTEKSLPKLAEKFDVWKAKADARAAEAEVTDAEVDEANEVEAMVADADEEFEELSYSPEELADMTIKQLRALCEEYQLEAPAKAKKAELIELLS